MSRDRGREQFLSNCDENFVSPRHPCKLLLIPLLFVLPRISFYKYCFWTPIKYQTLSWVLGPSQWKPEEVPAGRSGERCPSFPMSAGLALLSFVPSPQSAIPGSPGSALQITARPWDDRETPRRKPAPERSRDTCTPHLGKHYGKEEKKETHLLFKLLLWWVSLLEQVSICSKAHRNKPAMICR